jgi:hypothetical protein
MLKFLSENEQLENHIDLTLVINLLILSSTCFFFQKKNFLFFIHLAKRAYRFPTRTMCLRTVKHLFAAYQLQRKKKQKSGEIPDV